MNTKFQGCLVLVFAMFMGCKNEPKQSVKSEVIKSEMRKKEVVYQVFTRLFGNTNTTNRRKRSRKV
jgi:hypothetical protein